MAEAFQASVNAAESKPLSAATTGELHTMIAARFAR
jgi:hypothetical protein